MRFNIIADGSCSTSAQNVDPLLGALADNGGPTKTLLPQAGSPAIDAGNQTDCTINGITTDQRGYTRIDGKCDIGSVEVGAEPASLQFTTTTSSVNENGVSITIDVTRSGGTANAVSVDYATADGTAVSTPLSSADYTAASGTLNFAVGETTKSITVAIVDDTVVEGDETFSVSLSNPQATPGAAELGSNTTDTVTIIDNDKASSGGGGATSPLMLLFAGLLWPMRRLRRRE